MMEELEQQNIAKLEKRKIAKTQYMLTTKWYCNICKNGKNYSLAGKWTHIKSKKYRHLENPKSLTHPNEWYCSVCKNGKDYTLKGEAQHLGTYKHMKNEFTQYKHITQCNSPTL